MSMIASTGRQLRRQRGYMGRGVRPQGDPGIFGDIWKGIKTVGGWILGGAGQQGPSMPGGAPPPGYPMPMPPGGPIIPPIAPGSLQAPVQGPSGGPGFTGVSIGGPAGFRIGRQLPAPPMPAPAQAQNGGPPAGHHLNKTSYFLRDGTFVPAGSKWVRNRRRNPLNPRALSRAISRIESGKRASQRLSRISIRKRKC